MDRPAKDPMNQGHCVVASKTAGFIAKNIYCFNKLEKELPKLDSDPFQIKEVKVDKKGDTEEGGSDLFKGQKVRGVVWCNEFEFPRAIYAMNALNISKLHLSRSVQKERLDKLDAFKDIYVCGDIFPVDGFEPR